MNAPANLSPSLTANPLLSDWIRFTDDEAVEALTGKSELGQGISTALTLVVARGLGLNPTQVRMVAPTTVISPDEGFTAGSLSVQHSGSALAQVCDRVRELFLTEARQHMGSDQVHLVNGQFTDGARTLTYWDMALNVDLDVTTADLTGGVNPASETTDLPRIDLADKILGRPRYLQDLRFPSQSFGRVIRPPFRGATIDQSDVAITSAHLGVQSVVIDGSFAGVVADSEIHAIEAAELLAQAITWTGTSDALSHADLVEFVVTAPTVDAPLMEKATTDNATAENSDHTLSARYSRPFIAHGSIGTSTAIAQWRGDELTVWSHTQGVYPLRTDLARALNHDIESITVHHVEGAGCYGHNPADDAAYDAVLLARSVPGSPVLVSWTREDELGWGPFGPAMVVDLAASFTADGKITSWDWNGYGNGHSSRPSTLSSPSLLAFGDQADGIPIPPSNDPPLVTGGGTARNGRPLYDIETITGSIHRLDVMPIRASALRSLGAHLNVFALESHIDDIAHQLDVDPLTYRLSQLSDPRGIAVLEKVAVMSDWGNRPSGESAGRGLGFARYKNSGAWCAVVADIIAEETVRVDRLWIAVDVGAVITRDGVLNQIEGGAIQSVSWTLKEEVRFADGRVTSSDWETYPIIRFSEVPHIQIEIIDHPDQPSLGSGECSMGPTAAALGNALFDAIGVRVRNLPLSPANIVTAMDE